ncbi:hypothetical protein V5P93_005466 [Actinokineospora auranticolor]|uniref:Uncharacterized protein n=1 Tax=Actinokineospora auranticolor TaxID=155976 RepID=A0A2S6GQK0_9PSEU|nr:hypothetical protein [Actinokineospora auranticolor]PPK67504.1 hypothetical protein CLV40_107168 [Actinokineospora auranticolor]
MVGATVVVGLWVVVVVMVGAAVVVVVVVVLVGGADELPSGALVDVCAVELSPTGGGGATSVGIA